jgi:hypothetical protein
MDLRDCEALFRFNQGMDQTLRSLNVVEKRDLGSPEGISRVRANLSDLRSYANNCIASKIARKEQEEENHFYRIGRNREKAEEGPNEIYLELKPRKEFRREHGLPPPAVILPWTQSDDDRILAMRNAASSSLPMQPEQPRIMSDTEQEQQEGGTPA